MSNVADVSFMTTFRAAIEDNRQQWVAANTNMLARVDQVLLELPSFLVTRIGESQLDGSRTMLLGVMVGYLEGRDNRIHEMQGEVLEGAARLIPMIEAGTEDPDSMSKLVDECRAQILAANADERANIPNDSHILGNYLSGHMHMRFRPHGRMQLAALVARHLDAILLDPRPSTMESEQSLGKTELACVAEIAASHTKPRC